ncbi:hypothetical protein BBJ28_00009384 [Nothophytophthora sp. Chile5]|nr:hypothetical protein BBJ28_00009384 [Nothophytophthora sp. Chile5]
MQTFPLRFRDGALEEAFRKHFNMYVVKKVRVASRILTALNAVMLAAQYATQTQVWNDCVFLSRVGVVALSLIFHTATFVGWFHRHFDQFMLAHYVLQGFVVQLPRFSTLTGLLGGDEEAGGDDNSEFALFASLKSVRAMTLLYILNVFIVSGMRFTVASVCALCHIVVHLLFAVAFCRVCRLDEFEAATGLAMVAFCTVTAYHGERYVRQEFVARMSVDEERKRRDDLLETMLPVHIKERLKHNRTDGLAEHYDEVSILFCYVSDFQTLSKHASAIELVRLMNRIVFCFDRATDARDVYKVEAIAETYMCAAGVPQRDPFHCEKVADMALTMMRICEAERWSCNGVDIQLQIGIHSGPVVAGVVGCKTYSYHLFGDTVNTSSRVCSSGSAGKIQISDRSRQLLLRSGAFIISERGMMNLKGKGMVNLFWLEGKYAVPSRSGGISDTNVFGTFEAAMEESIRAGKLAHSSGLHHRSDEYLSFIDGVKISRSTLDFRRKQIKTATPKWPRNLLKTARVQSSPGGSDGPTIPMQTIESSDVGGVQAVPSNTASEMESIFRADHNRDSTPQFFMALYTCVGFLLVIIVPRAYQKELEPNATPQDAAAYALYCTTITTLLLVVYLLRRYPRLFALKEAWATVTGFLFVLAMNLQLLRLPGPTTTGDVQPSGTEQTVIYLDANLLHAVLFGLVLKLRFRNAALVNAWGFAVYVVCTVLRRGEAWTNRAEDFFLLLAGALLATHFGYKRELGLRRDFLLKCTLRLEKQKCEDLLTNMLPSTQYAEALMQQSTVVDELAEVTLLYSDMVGFTALGATLNPGAICVLLNQIYSAFDRHLDELGIYKMDTVGDAFIVIGGLPTHKSSKNHAAAITAFAVEMLREIDAFCSKTNVTLQMRIGIHTGKVVGGVVGIKKPRYLIWGHHTVVANLMESRGIPGRIQLSEDTYAHLHECPDFHVDGHVGSVKISENTAIRTYFLASDHPSVKDVVVGRYLHQLRSISTLNAHALAQLRSCLHPPTNSPLSKQLEAPQASQQQIEQEAAAMGITSSAPKMVKSTSFGSIISNR